MFKNTGKLTKISMSFSCASLIFLAIPFGITAFVLAIIGSVKDEEDATIAILMSLTIPPLSFLLSMIIFSVV